MDVELDFRLELDFRPVAILNRVCVGGAAPAPGPGGDAFRSIVSNTRLGDAYDGRRPLVRRVVRNLRGECVIFFLPDVRCGRVQFTVLEVIPRACFFEQTFFKYSRVDVRTMHGRIGARKGGLFRCGL